jgi:hypothetical protein
MTDRAHRGVLCRTPQRRRERDDEIVTVERIMNNRIIADVDRNVPASSRGRGERR